MGVDKYTKLAELIRQLSENNSVWLVQAKVKAVNGDTCTVTVGDESRPDSLIELTGVSLRASVAGTNDKLLLTPAVGSVVLLGSLTGDLTDLSVLQVDNIAEFSYKSADFSLIADKDGLRVQNKGESLKNALNDFIAEMQKVVVSIGTTPNVAALEKIKQRINKILR